MFKISIILPVYNGEKYIKDAIQSVLNQSFLDWELLVIDDASTDKTREIIEEFSRKDKRIIYIKNEENLGIQKTLNIGLKHAKGEYIARIDDDDAWIDSIKLEKQIRFLEENKDHVLVGTGVINVDEKNHELFRFLNPLTDIEIKKKLLTKNCFIHSSVVFRRDIAMKFGGYDETEHTKHVEDYDLWLKLGSVGKLANLPLYGVKFMMRKSSLSGKNKKEQFRKDLLLAKQYRNMYPNYYEALIRGYMRLLLYGVFDLLPIAALKNKILKIYKSR